MSELHRQEPSSTPTRPTQEFLDGWFKSAGAEPIVVVEMNACAPMPGYVRRLGIPCIMSPLGAPKPRIFRIVPIENPAPMRVPGVALEPYSRADGGEIIFAAIVRRAIVGAAGKA